MTDIVERLRGLVYQEEWLEEAADEVERLRAAVWAAIPWFDDMAHMGGLIDQDRRAGTLAQLRAAVGVNEQKPDYAQELVDQAQALNMGYGQSSALNEDV